MQKKLIALAVAGLAATGAYAQSNVTIYGVADASFEQASATGATGTNANPSVTTNMSSRTRLVTNNSYIGFKGAESLGNGLTAVFQMETNVNMDQNGSTSTTNTMFGSSRDTFVGLAGGFGTVAAGYLSTPTRSLYAGMDLVPGATGAGAVGSLIGRVNVGGALNPLNAQGQTTGNSMNNTATLNGNNTGNNLGTIFRSQAIAYITPTVGGFSGVAAYVPTESKDLSVTGSNNYQRKPGAWNLAANYANGPLSAGYALLKLKDVGTDGAAGGAQAAIGAGAPNGAGLTGEQKHTYQLAAVKYVLPTNTTLMAMVDQFKGEFGYGSAAPAASEKTIKRTAWAVGVKQEFGANEVVFQYARVGDNKVTCVGACAAGSNYGDSGANQYSLRYGYNFSKRTQAYALYSRINNDKNGNFDFGPGTGAGTVAQNGGNAVGAGANPQTLGVGIRHNF